MKRFVFAVLIFLILLPVNALPAALDNLECLTARDLLFKNVGWNSLCIMKLESIGWGDEGGWDWD